MLGDLRGLRLAKAGEAQLGDLIVVDAQLGLLQRLGANERTIPASSRATSGASPSATRSRVYERSPAGATTTLWTRPEAGRTTV
jgi:hypothetical protein